MAIPHLNVHRLPSNAGIISPPYNGAMYEHDGNYFSGDGTFMFRLDDKVIEDESGPIDFAAPGGDDDGAGAGGEEFTEDPNVTDLRAWAMGKANYPFFQVKGEAKKQYPDMDVANAKTIIDGLVERKVLRRDQVRR